MASSYFPAYSAEKLRQLGDLAHESCVDEGVELGKLAKGWGKAGLGSDIVTLFDYRDLETLILDAGHEVSPLARTIACLVALSRLESAAFSGPEVEHLFGYTGVASATLSHEQVQAQLSRLLVDFPVLMDPHLRVRTSLGGERYSSATIACQIAKLDHTALPRLAHGIGEAELQRFAAHPCVFDGLRAAGTYEGDKTPLKLATAPDSFPESPGVVRGAFIDSFLQLGRLGRAVTGKDLLTEMCHMLGGDRQCGADLMRCIAAIFWDAAAGGGKSGLSRQEVVALLTTPTLSLDASDKEPRPIGHAKPPYAPLEGFLGHHLSSTISHGLFSLLPPNTASMSPWFRTTPADGRATTARVKAAVELMVDCGMAADRQAAATWLARQVVDENHWERPPTIDWASTAPDCAPEVAAAFLRAVSMNGARVAVGEQLESTTGTKARPHVLSTWLPIARALTIELEMMDVVAARPTAAEAQARNAGRERRMVV